MDFKHISNYNSSKAEMRIYTDIGGYDGISGEQFANEMEWLILDGCKMIDVRINSVGGKMLEGYSILSTILKHNSQNECVINTYNDGVAASTAGWILMAGKKVYMMDYANIYLHDPNFGDTKYEDLDDKSKEVISVFKKSVATIFKNKTGMTSEQVSEIMTKETWYNAEQSMEMGFVDEIISTSISVPAMSNDARKFQEICNQVINKKVEIQKEINMELLNQEIATVLNAANVAEALSNIQKLKAENEGLRTSKENLEASNTDLANQIEEYKQKEAELLKSQAEQLVNTAIKEQRINASQKETWINLAMNSYEHARNAIDSIRPTKLTTVIEQAKTASNADDRSDWSYMKWTKEDSKGLAEMKNSDPELFNEIRNKK